MSIMNKLKPAAWFFGAALAWPSLAQTSNFEPGKILERPLITGASVSADWSTSSPGKTLALRYTEKSKIKTIAFGGRPGRDVIKSIRPQDVKDRSIIMAVDFLFWDSTLSETAPSIQALESLIKQASERSLPLVLGEIPELLPGRQGQRARLNQALAAQCRSYARCVLMPFDRLHQQILRDGHLEIKGRKYTMKELVPDGLHLSPHTSEYLADTMLALLGS